MRDAILIGAVLAVLVLLLFLRNWRLTLVAALHAAAHGHLDLLPDVAVRRVHQPHVDGRPGRRHRPRDRRRGGRRREHPSTARRSVATPRPIEDATGELVAPIVGSTLTTVVVFAPLGLLSGVVGDFFKALSITLSVAVLISMVLALFLIPLLARRVVPCALRPPQHHGDRRGSLDRWYVSTLPVLLQPADRGAC